MAWRYHQASGFAGIRCDVWFGERCNRAKEGQKELGSQTLLSARGLELQHVRDKLRTDRSGVRLSHKSASTDRALSAQVSSSSFIPALVISIP